ncbi:MAG: ABC-F family ATP-binding cassette domain-containing protein [Candidatus Gracilibacteria bacterium]|nr:ABC-F family ATP-binding cassette domain-containing protein [Candidatus Gracilibacteria bacterium]
MKHLKIKIDKYEVDGNIILKDIDFILNENDSIALVGGNGVGKTTLMKIITGEIKDFDGIIENIGNMSIGYLSQIYTDNENKIVREEIKDGFKDICFMEKELEELEKLMNNCRDNSGIISTVNNMEIIEKYTSLLEQFNNIGGYNYNNQIHSVANGMGILHLLDKKLCEISGGERTKVALCKILVESPDILCLDEPTNFIDMKSVEWLESYLQNKWGNGYLIISHDREFLDKTCAKTFEMQPTRAINFYFCNYSKYVLEREKIENIKMEEYERQQEFIKKEENLINRFRAGSRAGFAASREKALERLEKLEKPFIPSVPKFFFDYVDDESERILYFKECFIGRKEPLFFINELYLNRKARVGIIGENGVGKSTLLKTIMGQLEVLDGIWTRGKGLKIIYYSQLHEELDKNKTIRENFLLHGLHFEDQQLIGYLKYYLLEKETIDKPVKYLSGGQISKVLFAILGQKESNFLIFDEPTNHLDYDSRESLEKAISNYKGTVLFISHDRYFVNKIAEMMWIIKNGELTLSYGNYEDYKYKLEHGIDIEMNLFDESAEMEIVLIEKLGEKEAKRLKDKFTRKKNN